MDFEPALVSVTREADGLPLAGIKVVVFDAATNLPIAGPLVTDDAGLCDFGLLQVGEPRLLVFGGAQWRVHSQEDWYGGLPFRTGKAAGGADRAAASLMSPPVSVASVVMRPRRPTGTLPRMTGTVIDADTGLPLDLAFVGLSPYVTGYGGEIQASDDVTAADGVFVVHDVVVGWNPETGSGFQITPLIVSRRGYRSAVWRYQPEYGIDHLDITDLEIPLRRLGVGDTGVLTGAVLRAGAPLADVVVGLGPAPTGKSAPGVVGQIAVTGPDGRYRFTGLAAGAYVVHPGFLVGDGVWLPRGPATVPWLVDAGRETIAAPMAVVHEIDPWQGNGATYGRTLATALFSWSPVPGAVDYLFILDGTVWDETSTNSLAVDLTAMATGLHRWQVTAVAADDSYSAVMQNDAWFRRLE